jgi:hypothetical protein
MVTREAHPLSDSREAIHGRGGQCGVVRKKPHARVRWDERGDGENRSAIVWRPFACGEMARASSSFFIRVSRCSIFRRCSSRSKVSIRPHRDAMPSNRALTRSANALMSSFVAVVFNPSLIIAACVSMVIVFCALCLHSIDEPRAVSMAGVDGGVSRVRRWPDAGEHP